MLLMKGGGAVRGLYSALLNRLHLLLLELKEGMLSRIVAEYNFTDSKAGFNCLN